MTTQSHLGKQVYYSPVGPATNDAAGFEALTWTRINGFQGGLQLGSEANDIEVADLGEGTILGVKGMRTFNNSTLTFRDVPSDAGQTAIATLARGAGSEGAIKVISAETGAAAQSGDAVQYCKGYWHSYIENEINGDGHEGFFVGFRQNSDAVDAVEPV